MSKRFKWSIKIVCLFVVLTGLLFNGPLVDLHKKVVADNFNRDLKPYKSAVVSPQPPIEGEISKVVIPKLKLSFDSNELMLSADIVNQFSNLLVQTDKTMPAIELAPGDRVYIFTANGHRFIYQFEKDISKTDTTSFIDRASLSLMLQFYNYDYKTILSFNLVEAQ
ncbi:MAG TPA: hypothetical protein VNX65_00405 [Patescibacteria group bacterium]|jgi:hypothetical protein|nr:hypothetical protein [Patescibacteria group bacterium]